MSDEGLHWPWVELGIASNSNQTDVRRAYARRLKTLNLEDQPEEFQALRAAYEFARQIAPHASSESGLPAAAAEPPEPPHKPEPVQTHSAEAEMSAVLADVPSLLTQNTPPVVQKPSGAGARKPTIEPDTLTFDEAVACLPLLLDAEHVLLSDWRNLLSQPVLDDLHFSQFFEGALLEALADRRSYRGKLIETAAFRDLEWLRLIEDRYGWQADGLRFQAMFPQHLEIRSDYVEERRLTGLTPTIARPSEPRLSKLQLALRMVFRPPLLLILIFFGTLIGLGGGARSVYTPVFNTALLIIGIIWFVLPPAWKARRISVPARFDTWQWAHWLRRRAMAVSITNITSSCLLLLFLAAVAVPNLRAGWITDREVSSSANTTPHWTELRNPISPTYSEVEKAARAVSSGKIKSDEALLQMNMPFPMIVLPDEQPLTTDGDPQNKDWPVGTSLTCGRDETCQLAIEIDLPLSVGMSLSWKEDPEIMTPGRVRAHWKWVRGEPVKAPTLIPDAIRQHVNLPAPLGGDYDQMNSFTSRLTLYLAGLAVSRPSETEALQLMVTTQKRDSGALIIENCEEHLVSRGWESWMLANRQAARHLAEICSLPTDMARVGFRVTEPAWIGDDDVIRLPLTDARQRMMLEYVADDTMTGVRESEVAAIAWAVGDQILRDYLTIFWSAPLPQELADYLERHPLISVPQSRPEKVEIVAAARNQRHLTNAYRFRDTIGMALLQDMFDYLSNARLLRP